MATILWVDVSKTIIVTFTLGLLLTTTPRTPDPVFGISIEAASPEVSDIGAEVFVAETPSSTQPHSIGLSVLEWLLPFSSQTFILPSAKKSFEDLLEILREFVRARGVWMSRAWPASKTIHAFMRSCEH